MKRLLVLLIVSLGLEIFLSQIAYAEYAKNNRGKAFTDEKILEYRWMAAGFKNVDVETWNSQLLYPSNNVVMSFTHEVNLTAVKLRNVLLTREDILERFVHLAKVIASCSIKLSSVKFVELDFPSKAVFNLAKKLPLLDEKPIFIYLLSEEKAAILPFSNAVLLSGDEKESKASREAYELAQFLEIFNNNKLSRFESFLDIFNPEQCWQFYKSEFIKAL